jgi:hypothetical protein
MLQRILLSLFLAAGALRAAPSDARGAFENFAVARPLLPWEKIKGYRLFFHPDDPEPLRRSLVLVVPTERRVISSYALVRPLELRGKGEDAWLRIEGVPEPERVSFQWNGLYRGAEFPDKRYLFEIHVRWADGDRLDQEVVALKSLDHPRIAKIGGASLEEHPLVLRRGSWEAERISAGFSRAETPEVDLVAKVLAPDLEASFQTEGIQLSYRFVEDENGLPRLREDSWHCACQEALPLDSPARTKAKKVRCPWDIAGLAPGVYELRLSLFHKMKHSIQFDPCDTPILDEDRIRVRIRP